MIEHLFRRRRAALRYPIGDAPRTAVLGPWFRETRKPGPVAVFPSGWCAEAAEFAPVAIAATREQLLKLAASDPPALAHALIVIHQPGEVFLTGEERERLWRAFRVPAFEQIIGPRGELLAAECEAHDGLHVEVSRLNWDQYRVETTPCACGRKTPRLAHNQPAELTRAAAVYAR